MLPKTSPPLPKLKKTFLDGSISTRGGGGGGGGGADSLTYSVDYSGNHLSYVECPGIV